MEKVKNLFFIAIATISLASCGTILGVKKVYGLVGKPEDLKGLTIIDSSTGKNVPIIPQVLYTVHNSGNLHSNIPLPEYSYAGIGAYMKVKKNNTLMLTRDGVTKNIKVSGKGSFFIIYADVILTLGIGAIIDYSNGAHRLPRPRFIDVQSLFADKPQRTKKELISFIIQNYKGGW